MTSFLFPLIYFSNFFSDSKTLKASLKIIEVFFSDFINNLLSHKTGKKFKLASTLTRTKSAERELESVKI